MDQDTCIFTPPLPSSGERPGSSVRACHIRAHGAPRIPGEQVDEARIYDCLVIGGAPAGLAVATCFGRLLPDVCDQAS